MSAPLHVLAAAEDAAWERYVEASGRAIRMRGHQFDLTETAHDEANFWRSTWRACLLARYEWELQHGEFRA